MQKQNKMISKLRLMREPKGLVSIKTRFALPHHPNPSKMKEPMTLQKMRLLIGSQYCRFATVSGQIAAPLSAIYIRVLNY